VLGEIPLKDLTVIEKDVEQRDSSLPEKNGTPTIQSCVVNSTNSHPYYATMSMRSRIVLLTATGIRYELEANNRAERDSWAGFIRMATQSL